MRSEMALTLLCSISARTLANLSIVPMVSILGIPKTGQEDWRARRCTGLYDSAGNLRVEQSRRRAARRCGPRRMPPMQ